jgi:hypothetical protein
MEKEIEKAIRETLVISNQQSIHIAVKKILLLFSVSGRSEQLSDSLQDQIKRGELDPYSPHAKWIKP